MTRTITVSDEVWKALDGMGSTSDTFDSVIRRLIKQSGKTNLLQESEEEIRLNADLITSQGDRIPNNTKLRATYKRKQYHAIVKNGSIVTGEDRFFSPSMAAKKITGYNVNGWRFWETLNERGEWAPIAAQRDIWNQEEAGKNYE